MAITTYAELQTAVGNWLHRADLTAQIPDFITLAEVRIYNGTTDQYGNFVTEPLRVTAMQEQETGSISNQQIALPANYLQTIRLAVTSGGQNKPLEYKAPELFSWHENVAGDPYSYTVVDGAIKTAPTGALDYIHDYYEKFDSLSDANTTNWLLTNHPNVYLYGALLEAEPYIKNDARTQLWLSAFAGAIGGANKAEKVKYQSAAMRVMLG